MRGWLGGAALLAASTGLGQTARAAEHLDCMDAQVGEPERLILERYHNRRRAEEGLDAAVVQSIRARALVCGHLYGWSQAATNLAFTYRWSSTVNAFVERDNFFTPEQLARMDAAMEPRRAQYLAEFDGDVAAARRNEEGPPPPPGGLLGKYAFVMKAAAIPVTAETKQRFEGWLYGKGMIKALVAGFAAEQPVP